MSIFEKGSLSVGTYFDIPVKIHWTFGYIIFYIIYTGYTDQLGVIGAVWFGIFILSLFLCVILHEYGHALAARRYGVKTMDIILTPLGGIARLMKMPDKPIQELIVAIAGPAVNVIIAALIFVVMYFGLDINPFIHIDEELYSFEGNPAKFFSVLMIVNITLLIFNLLPVFPMDGGRVLRSLLAMKWSKVTATLIASRIGQVLSLGFIGFGLYSGNFMLALIGIFIFQGAYMEYRHTKAEDVLQNTTIEGLGQEEFQYFQHDDKIINSRELLNYTPQVFFPVYHESVALGSISREDILSSIDLYATLDTLTMKPMKELEYNAAWIQCYQTFSQEAIDLVFLMKDNVRVAILDKFTFYQQMVNKKLLRQSR